MDNLNQNGTYNGIPLTELGFWNVAVSNGQYQSNTASISNEAYELFTDSGAYDTIPSNWNAAAATADMVADFAADPEYFALTDGYSSLPDALKQQLQAAGVSATPGSSSERSAAARHRPIRSPAWPSTGRPIHSEEA